MPKAAPKGRAGPRRKAKPSRQARPAAKAARPSAGKPKFGRPGTAGKGEGDAAVQAWLAGVKPEHQEIVRRLDALATKTIPGVRKAVKWSTPLYGVEGLGWVAAIASFKEHVALRFFSGANLKPPPPDGTSALMRGISIRGAEDYDEKRFRSWFRQAGKIKGWGTV